MDDNYMTTEELRAIADYCEAVRPLWNALTMPPQHGINIETEDFSLSVYDSNGEKLGHIMWCDSGAAFYPGEKE